MSSKQINDKQGSVFLIENVGRSDCQSFHSLLILKITLTHKIKISYAHLKVSGFLL